MPRRHVLKNKLDDSKDSTETMKAWIKGTKMMFRIVKKHVSGDTRLAFN